MRGMKARICAAALGAAAVVPAGASAHDLFDHPVPTFSQPAPLSSAVNSGGEGASWELVTTIPTGNPHTDLDFFEQGGQIFASVGTLAIGPNAGGQTMVRLTDQQGNVDPEYLTAHPSASCLSDPSAATGLQHDAEAAPKGNTILNTDNPAADRSDTQVVIDATDAPGRCHDQGTLGLPGAPQGGLEIIDVTGLSEAEPVVKEIGMTSHIGEAHTVNVDPKRPHIAYAVTSDAIGVDPETGVRANEDPDGSPLALDGFEVVDFSSCMNFPPGTTIDQKRMQCRPEVFRYRYPSAAIAQGHTKTDEIYACHELEIYPDDTLTCGSGGALIEFDMSGAFDDNGTPTDFSDDHPNGTPLPCAERPSSTQGPLGTGATVIDCVNTDADADNELDVPNWLASGAPSLEGVEHLGSIYHQGRSAGNPVQPAFDSTEDIDFNHEAELSHSRRLLIATDERGGGILPPGASCAPGVDNAIGNGGVHFYEPSGLSTARPASADQAFQAYASTPGGEKAIFRVPIRTQPRGTVCTAHVFHQIPGENRIVMGWYSQGTHVIDFVENPDGTVRVEEAGFFIPENANQWVSAIFKSEQNPDGTVTYWGATGDFNLGEAGRNAIDVYRVTLPPAPEPLAASGGGPNAGGGDGAGNEGGACAQRIRGSKRADRMFGSIAGDTIRAGKGKDRVRAREGDDCVKGGGGRDRLFGDEGSDEVKGNRGRDHVKGGSGRDVLADVGKGRDRLNGGGGGDVIRARAGGKDIVLCGSGRDRAILDKRDKARGCERIKRPRRRR
jgi:hypothetical protein